MAVGGTAEVSGADRRLQAAETRSEARWSIALGWLATAAAGLPMLIAASALTFQRPDVVLDGDGAVDEVALMRATHLAQLVGNYTRFGWSHLGPAWFYALSLVYAPLGKHTWAFFVATLVLEALVACLIVAAAWRIRGPALAAVTAVLLLWLTFKLGLPVFRSIWPPYATILPIILFFLLAAFGAAGSTLAMVGAIVVGSYEAQLHVGTLPTVVVSLATMIVLRVLWHGRSIVPRLAALRERRLTLILLALGLLTLVAMWVPVAADQLTSRTGNLTKLTDFFFFQRLPHHPLHEGIAALGRQLVVFPLGQPPPGSEFDYSALTPSRFLAVNGFLVLSGGLAAIGTVLRDRFAQALGLLLFLATIGLTWSISRVVGALYAYFLLWTTTLPLLLIVGWAALIVGIRPWRWLPTRLESVSVRASAVVVVPVMLVLATVQTLAFLQLPSPSLGTDPQTRLATTLVGRALASEPHEPVLVTITTLDAWPTAAGVSLQLMKRGWSLSFRPESLFLFGEQLRASGRERLEVVFVAETNLDNFDQHAPGLQFVGKTGQTTCAQSGAPCAIYLFTRTLTSGG